MKNYIALCSAEMPKEITDALEADGYTCLSVPKNTDLPAPVASHPDMLFFVHSDQTDSTQTIMAPQAYREAHPYFFEQLNKLLKETGDTVITVTNGITVSNTYPNDISLNALELNGTLYSLTEHTAEPLKALFKNTVRVKQGYACCSTLKLNEESAITADKNIATALKNNGADVLLITQGAIRLKGYDYGFIGGASFCDRKTAYFFGDLNSHPNSYEISLFCQKHGIKVKSFPNIPLTDHGGIKTIRLKTL